MNDDVEFGSNFHNLKPTSFYNLQHNLSKSENLVITMNAEYSSTNSNTLITNILNNQPQPQSGLLSASISSTNNSTASGLNNMQTNYTRIPTFTGNNMKLNVGSSDASNTLTSTGNI